MNLINALCFYGGWEGHHPKENAIKIADTLKLRGYQIDLCDTLDCLNDADKLKSYDLIIPMWTMGQWKKEQVQHLSEAIKAGTGLAGYHGGMGDAFRGALDFEWMVGGHFVGHPYVGKYDIFCDTNHPLMIGMPETFQYNSEQYYMMLDPAIEILANTEYNHGGKVVKMPVVWLKKWGLGRVYYSALGHDLKEFEDHPYVFENIVHGMEWATRKET